MREWVRPFLIKKAKDELEQELGLQVKDGWRERYASQLGRNSVVYYKLTNCLNTHFGLEGLDETKERIIRAFGSVLASLPEEVFTNLYSNKNLFFSFALKAEAEVKEFYLDHDIKPGEKVQVVTFPYASEHMPPEALRGELVQGLIQIHYGNKLNMKEISEKMDAIAKDWGFEEELIAYISYRAGIRAKTHSNDFHEAC